MNKTAVSLRACLSISCFLCSMFARAQIPVTDAIQDGFSTVTHYWFLGKQYAQDYQSFVQLVNQLQQAKQHYASITGLRGLGNILLEDYGKVSPSSAANALDILNGNGQTTTFAKQFVEETTQLSQPYFEEVSPDIVGTLRQTMEGHAAQKGANASVYQSAVERYSRMDDLRAQIECTQDLKAIAELQARLQAESMIAQNELVKIQAMNGLLAADRDLQQQKHLQELYEITGTAY
jgi:type IV secretion system protein VirB5